MTNNFNPLGIGCVQCTPSDPCERCREQIKAEDDKAEATEYAAWLARQVN